MIGALQLLLFVLLAVSGMQVVRTREPVAQAIVVSFYGLLLALPVAGGGSGGAFLDAADHGARGHFLSLGSDDDQGAAGRVEEQGDRCLETGDHVDRPEPTARPYGEQQQDDEQQLKQQRELAKKFNKERHEALKRDTEKLLQLATELKQYVDKSNENLLSLDVVKKSEEIERLAHSVKDKMKGN